MANSMTMNAFRHKCRRAMTPFYDENLSKEEYRARCGEIRDCQNKLKAARDKYEEKGFK